MKFIDFSLRHIKVPAFTLFAKKNVIDDVKGLIATLSLVLNNELQQLNLEFLIKSSNSQMLRDKKIEQG